MTLSEYLPGSWTRGRAPPTPTALHPTPNTQPNTTTRLCYPFFCRGDSFSGHVPRLSPTSNVALSPPTTFPRPGTFPLQTAYSALVGWFLGVLRQRSIVFLFFLVFFFFLKILFFPPFFSFFSATISSPTFFFQHVSPSATSFRTPPDMAGLPLLAVPSFPPLLL